MASNNNKNRPTMIKNAQENTFPVQKGWRGPGCPSREAFGRAASPTGMDWEAALLGTMVCEPL